MTEIRFYHLQRQSLEEALPALLQKALQAGHRIVVKMPDAEYVRHFDKHLWTWNPNSFLPHGAAPDEKAGMQPVWLTAEEGDVPNSAQMLVLTNADEAPDISGFALCCDMFDGRDDSAVQNARARWKTWKEQGHEISYWQQGERGWEQKA